MSKLNHMLLDWKPGDIHGLEWMRSREIDQRLAYSYYEDGYLDKIGPGVFSKNNDEIDPLGIVRFLQEELELKLHISGRTALELQGHAHYLPMGDVSRIYLVSYDNRTFPSWIERIDNKFKLMFKKSSLFKQEEFLLSYQDRGFDVKVSSRELAILEWIDTLDLSNSLEIAQNYLESLLTLRSNVVQNALEKCNSIKVKRVFLYLAEKVNLPCYEKLDIEKINLGQGKRVIVKGGELNKKYQITVDRKYEENLF